MNLREKILAAVILEAQDAQGTPIEAPADTRVTLRSLLLLLRNPLQGTPKSEPTGER